MSKKTVDELVAELPVTHHGYRCWGASLDERGRQFIAGVIAREQTGVKLLRSRIVEVLNSEFGVKIGVEALKRHMTGQCSCG